MAWKTITEFMNSRPEPQTEEIRNEEPQTEESHREEPAIITEPSPTTEQVEKKPSGMDDYLSLYGWHFSKKMAEYGCRKLGKCDNLVSTECLEILSKDFDVMKNNNGCDAHYLFCRFKALFPDHGEVQLTKLVDDYLRNNHSTSAFVHFVADCKALGIAICWDEMI